MTNVRLCFLGNSHLAAIHLAIIRQPPSSSRFEIKTFAATSRGLEDLVVQGKKLVPKSKNVQREIELSSGGQRSINISDFDGIILYGLGFGLFRGPRWLTHYRTACSLGSENAPHLVSSAFLAESFRDILKSTALFSVLRRVREICDTPIFVVPTPYLSDALLNTEYLSKAESFAGRQLSGIQLNLINADNYRNLAQSNSLKQFSEIYEKALNEFEIKFNIRFIIQPEETICREFFTKQKYSVGSVRLNSKLAHPPDDFFHMNEEFGLKMLNKILHTTEATLPPPSKLKRMIRRGCRISERFR